MTLNALSIAADRARHRLLPSGWTAATLLIACLVALPVVVVASRILVPTDGVWSHLASTVLPYYLGNTAKLVLGVGAGTLVIGVGTAWLVTMCRFPGSRVLEWALLLPMAVPAYVMAYVYTDLLQFVGPVQTTLRELTGWTRHDYWFPNIRSLGGAVAMLTLVLYPYVYLLSRAAFLEQSVCVLEVSRTLGRGPYRSFFGVALPLARPAIVAGLALVLMEVLADFGTVQYFAVDTFTTGIYRTWFAMGQPVAAAPLGQHGHRALDELVVRDALAHVREHRTRLRAGDGQGTVQPVRGEMQGAGLAFPVQAEALGLFGLEAGLLGDQPLAERHRLGRHGLAQRPHAVALPRRQPQRVGQLQGMHGTRVAVQLRRERHAHAAPGAEVG